MARSRSPKGSWGLGRSNSAPSGWGSISTSPTLKRNALGSRTAWLRPVMKTLAEVIGGMSCEIYQCHILSCPGNRSKTCAPPPTELPGNQTGSLPGVKQTTALVSPAETPHIVQPRSPARAMNPPGNQVPFPARAGRTPSSPVHDATNW